MFRADARRYNLRGTDAKIYNLRGTDVGNKRGKDTTREELRQETRKVKMPHVLE